MKKQFGQVLRLGGLIVEMLSVFLILREQGGDSIPMLRPPGMPPVPLGRVGLGVGFVIWLVGTILVHSSRPSRKPASMPEDREA